MAGAPAASTSYTPSAMGTYGNNPLAAQVQVPQNLFTGLGPSALYAPSNLQLQTYTPTDVSSLANTFQSDASILNAPYPTDTAGYQKWLAANQNIGSDESALISAQNSNLAGYNATNAANAKDLGFLQQAAIAQNRMLGDLNSRGLLQSYEQGGAGTADMQQLQNSLNNAAADQGVGLQNELSGITANDAMYQMALQNYNNEMNNFNQYKSSQTPGFSDILGLGFSALPLILGI